MSQRESGVAGVGEGLDSDGLDGAVGGLALARLGRSPASAPSPAVAQGPQAPNFAVVEWAPP